MQYSIDFFITIAIAIANALVGVIYKVSIAGYFSISFERITFILFWDFDTKSLFVNLLPHFIWGKTPQNNFSQNLNIGPDCLCLLCRKIVNFLLVILTNNQLFSDITGCYLKTASYRWLQRFCLLFSKLLILNNQGHRRWLFSISNKVTSKNSVSMYVVSSKSEDYSWSYPIEYIFDRGHGSNDNWLGPI